MQSGLLLLVQSSGLLLVKEPGRLADGVAVESMAPTRDTETRPANLRLLAACLIIGSLIGVFIGFVGIQSQGDVDSAGFGRHSLVAVGIPFVAGSCAVLALTFAWLGTTRNDRWLQSAIGIAAALLLDLVAYVSIAG
jgi:hypothetical protein